MDRYLFGVVLIIVSSINVAVCIINGETVPNNDFPAQVAIYGKNESTRIICGGTIIDKKHILTSASCVVLKDQDYLVYPETINILKDRKITSTTAKHAVAAIFIHDRFHPRTHENDIAIIRTQNDIPGAENADNIPALDQEFTEELTPCRIAGHHLVTDELTTNGVDATFMAIKLVDKKSCNEEQNHGGKVLENMFRATKTQSLNDRVGMCETARGGALYCLQQNKFVFGVLSFGFGCGQSQIPSVFSQVGKYTDWIKEQPKRTDTPQYGPIQIPTGPTGPVEPPHKCSGTNIVAHLWQLLIVYVVGRFLGNKL